MRPSGLILAAVTVTLGLVCGCASSSKKPYLPGKKKVIVPRAESTLGSSSVKVATPAPAVTIAKKAGTAMSGTAASSSQAAAAVATTGSQGVSSAAVESSATDFHDHHHDNVISPGPAVVAAPQPRLVIQPGPTGIESLPTAKTEPLGPAPVVGPSSPEPLVQVVVPEPAAETSTADASSAVSASPELGPDGIPMAKTYPAGTFAESVPNVVVNDPPPSAVETVGAAESATGPVIVSTEPAPPPAGVVEPAAVAEPAPAPADSGASKADLESLIADYEQKLSRNESKMAEAKGDTDKMQSLYTRSTLDLAAFTRKWYAANREASGSLEPQQAKQLGDRFLSLSERSETLLNQFKK